MAYFYSMVKKRHFGPPPVPAGDLLRPPPPPVTGSCWESSEQMQTVVGTG